MRHHTSPGCWPTMTRARNKPLLLMGRPRRWECCLGVPLEASSICWCWEVVRKGIQLKKIQGKEKVQGKVNVFTLRKRREQLEDPKVSCVGVWLVVSNSVRPYGLQPTRLLCPWCSPGKNTGVDRHALLQGIFPTQESKQCLLCLLHWQVDTLPLGPPEKSDITNTVYKSLLLYFDVLSLEKSIEQYLHQAHDK